MPTTTTTTSATETTMTMRQTGLTARTFGVELEMFVNVPRAIAELQAAGIEVAAEGLNHTTRSYWKLVSDGSVRDPVTGMNYLTARNGEHLGAIELVSPILTGEAGLVAVETVCAALNRVGAKVNRTCGLHVHHGAHDLTVANLATLARLTNRFETVIDGCLPESRRGGQNTYCGAFTTDELDRIDSAESKSALGYTNRYRNLNLAALSRHGTVEFRQHSGTTEGSKVVAWILLTQGLVEAAKAKTRARKGRDKRRPTADGLDNLLRAAGLRSCAPHGHVVAESAKARAAGACAYLLARAKEFGVLDVTASSARRSRARRATEGGGAAAAGGGEAA